MQRYQWNFVPLPNTTGPGFLTSAIEASTGGAYALEGTATGRVWQGPTRAVRLTEQNGVDYFVQFATASTLALPSSVDAMLVLGGVSEVFKVMPNWTHIGIKSAGTTAVVNVTLGYGV